MQIAIDEHDFHRRLPDILPELQSLSLQIFPNTNQPPTKMKRRPAAQALSQSFLQAQKIVHSISGVSHDSASNSKKSG
jgi:hypothetical protein